MCGIAGVFAYDPRAPVIDRAELQRSCDWMGCRGPDGKGAWFSDDGRVGLGHRRLAILDLSERGAQPMESADGRYVISFNGEIYNYRALRRELEATGHEFRSGSDTEVLLQLFAAKGEAMVHDLRGMFAFAIWDAVRERLFLARDLFGIKPLYYSDDGRSIRLASEVKALLAGGGIDTAPEPAGHAGFFLWGSVPEPYTLYRGVRALPAGHVMSVSREEIDVHRYAGLEDLLHDRQVQDGAVSACDAGEMLRDALLDSVRHHLVADVDVGVFLSAGLDSTTLAALAAQIGGRVKTVTLGFVEYRGTDQDEVPLAELVARSYGLDHQTIWVTRRDFESERDRLLGRMDQPTIDGVNSYFVSRAAAEAGLKVALSGLGGDELFGGYPSFHQLPRLVATVGAIPGSRTIGRGIRSVVAPMLRPFTSQKFAGLLEYGDDYGGAYLLRRGLFLPWELDRVLDPELAREGLETLAPRAMLAATAAPYALDRFKISSLEAAGYMRNQLLRDTDWASMSWSLEVRVPLVDPALWRVVAGLIGTGARIDKRAMAATPAPSLPAALLYRAKSGFAIPTNEWIAGEASPHSVSRGLRGWALRVYRAHVGGKVS
jgi:asparagine synthase (glutamine-hydrolysing)